MTTWEVSFKIKYNYPFIKMSELHPGSKISMWCVWDAEMIHVPPGHEDVISEVAQYVDKLGLSVDNYKQSSDGFVLTLKCSCDLLHNVWDAMDRRNCIPMHPAAFLDGWGYYRMVSLSEEDTRNFFNDLRELGPTELIQKRQVRSDGIPSMVRVESFFTGLTDKQIESIVKAYDYGYYASPRDVTTGSVASSLGITRSTYEEHLRKAENKIMEAIIPYLKLFRTVPRRREESVTPSARSPVVEA